VVCEQRYERKVEHQFLCGRRKCKSEYAQWPHVYLPFGPKVTRGLDDRFRVGRKARKTAFEMPHGLRSWVWQALSGEDQDYELLDGQGKVVARVRQEGAHWWVARPCCSPEPPLETLDQARARAISMALATLPQGTAENRAKNRAIIKAVLKEREQHPYRFSGAAERYAAAASGVAPATAAPAAADDDLDIPDYLRRTPQVVPA
jgi:hypothetical protein